MKTYMTSCDPARGGAYVVNISGVSKKNLEEIKEKCLSIEPEKNMVESTVSVCPLNNEEIGVSFVVRRKSNFEKRNHPVAQGRIIKANELAVELNEMLEMTFEKALFQELDDNEKITKKIKKANIKSDYSLEKYLNGFNKNFKIDFFYAIVRLIQENQRAILILDKEDRIKILVIIYSLIPVELVTQIYTIVNGESPMNPPDILLKDDVVWQKNVYEYKKMNLDMFLQYGSEYKKMHVRYLVLEKCMTLSIAFLNKMYKKCFENIQKYELNTINTNSSAEDVLKKYEIFLELFFMKYKKEDFQCNIKQMQEKICDLTNSREITELILKDELKNYSMQEEVSKKDVNLVSNIKFAKQQQLRNINVPQEVNEFHIITHLRNMCMDYIGNGNRDDTGVEYNNIREIIRKELNNQSVQWEHLKEQLQKELYQYDVKRNEREKFVKIIFLSFQYTIDGEGRRQANQLISAYNIPEMIKFIDLKYARFATGKWAIKEIRRQLLEWT